MTYSGYLSTSILLGSAHIRDYHTVLIKFAFVYYLFDSTDYFL